MSRKMLRKSSIRNSPRFTPSPRNKKSAHADAFLFEVEHIEGSLSLKPKSDEKLGSTKKLVANKSTSNVSISAKQKNVHSPMFSSLKTDVNSESSETNDEKKLTKKVNRKKKIRNTQELNIFIGDESYSEVRAKVKTKKTKKIKVPNFLPLIDMVEDDKNPSSAYNSTDCDNKENENNAKESTKRKRGRSRKNRKHTLAKNNSDSCNELDDQKPSPLLSSENYNTDSNGEQEESGGKDRMQMTRKVSKKSRKLIQKDFKASPYDEDHIFVVQDSTVGTTLPDSVAKCSNNESKFQETVLDSVSVIESAQKKPTLKREGTFEISSRNPVELFSEDVNMSDSTTQSTRYTYCIVPQIKSNKPKISKKTSIQSNIMETIDLTESPVTANSELKHTADERSNSEEISPKIINKECIGIITTNATVVNASPSVKVSLDNSKSSFEISFNVKKRSADDLLDNLNITRRDSRKSSYKKSSKSIGYSNGNEDEDTKGSFITVRRKHHTMTDFNTTDTSDESFNEKNIGLKKYKNFEKLNEKELTEKNVCLQDGSIFDSTNSPVPKQTVGSRKTSILKKSVRGEDLNPKRDTFELLENHFEIMSNAPMYTTETTFNKNAQAQSDIFDMVSKTPTTELGHIMIESGESIVLNNSFANRTDFPPRLTKMGTFTMNKECSDTSKNEERKSTRKRWSQVEKVSILDYTAPNENLKDPVNTTKTKSVTFGLSPLKSNLSLKPINVTTEKELTRKYSKIDNSDTQNTSKLKTVSFLSSPAGNNMSKPKGKKSVRIESPLSTPKIRLHSPLAIKKTPLPYKAKHNSSILAGNCAFSKTPPTAESTPYPKKKEVSLLKKALTNEKSKGEKSVKCPSSRVKMPNFRKIHERQFEKMENIKELQERKAVRAQYLMSGHKIISNASTSTDVEKESRKKLRFSPLKSEAAAVKKISKPLQRMLNKRASLEKKKKELKSKLPVLAKLNLSNKNNSTNSQNPVPVVLSAPNKGIPVEKKTETTGRTRLGFKLPINGSSTKEAQIKAVAAKTKLAVDRKERSRAQQTTVRTNRRFELLMQMRANKK